MVPDRLPPAQQPGYPIGKPLPPTPQKKTAEPPKWQSVEVLLDDLDAHVEKDELSRPSPSQNKAMQQPLTPTWNTKADSQKARAKESPRAKEPPLYSNPLYDASTVTEERISQGRVSTPANPTPADTATPPITGRDVAQENAAPPAGRARSPSELEMDKALEKRPPSIKPGEFEDLLHPTVPKRAEREGPPPPPTGREKDFDALSRHMKRQGAERDVNAAMAQYPLGEKRDPGVDETGRSYLKEVPAQHAKKNEPRSLMDVFKLPLRLPRLFSSGKTALGEIKFGKTVGEAFDAVKEHTWDVAKARVERFRDGNRIYRNDFTIRM